MTLDECAKILAVIDASFPNFNIKDEDVESTKKAWYIFLKDYGYAEIETALRVYVSTSGSAFAPSVAELILYSQKAKELSQTDAITAWTQVRKAIRRSLYYAEEEFYSLPVLAQKVVGYPEQLRSWAQMESKEIDTVVWSNFKRSYEIMQKRENEIALIPEDIRKLIQDNNLMLGVAKKEGDKKDGKEI